MMSNDDDDDDDDDTPRAPFLAPAQYRLHQDAKIDM